MLTCKYCAHLKKCIADANKRGCEHNPDYEGEGGCPYYGFKRNTNADRIRAMSDEDLAKYLFDVEQGNFTIDCCDDRFCDTQNCCHDCTDAAIKWLKQPVKDGESG